MGEQRTDIKIELKNDIEIKWKSTLKAYTTFSLQHCDWVSRVFNRLRIHGISYDNTEKEQKRKYKITHTHTHTHTYIAISKIENTNQKEIKI